MLKTAIPYQVGIHLAHVYTLMRSWTIDPSLWSLFWSLVDFFDLTVPSATHTPLSTLTPLTALVPLNGSLNPEENKTSSGKPYRGLFSAELEDSSPQLLQLKTSRIPAAVMKIVVSYDSVRTNKEIVERIFELPLNF